MQQRRSYGQAAQTFAPRQRSQAYRTTGVASVRYLPSGLLLMLEAPYNKPFTDEMKKSIPTKKRSWDNNDKSWYVAADQFDRLSHLLDKHYDETILLDFPVQDVSNDAWSKLFLIQGAPIELIQSAYRLLAKKHHPDKGGDPVKMSEINNAYTELMGEFSDGEPS